MSQSTQPNRKIRAKQSGLNYELGISVYDNALVWLNGPFKASQHDLTIFRSANGLKEIIPEGRKVIADNGYTSAQEHILSTPNSNDPREVRKFKSRARARHESFNGKKNFRSLAEQFRHGVTKLCLRLCVSYVNTNSKMARPCLMLSKLFKTQVYLS